MQVTGFQFADDLALYAVNHAAFESAGRKFVQVAGLFGLTVSLPKTKGLPMGAVLSENDVSSVKVEGGVIEMVKGFNYLDSSLSADGEATGEVNC